MKIRRLTVGDSRESPGRESSVACWWETGAAAAISRRVERSEILACVAFVVQTAVIAQREMVGRVDLSLVELVLFESSRLSVV